MYCVVISNWDTSHQLLPVLTTALLSPEIALFHFGNMGCYVKIAQKQFFWIFVMKNNCCLRLFFYVIGGRFNSIWGRHLPTCATVKAKIKKNGSRRADESPDGERLPLHIDTWNTNRDDTSALWTFKTPFPDRVRRYFTYLSISFSILYDDHNFGIPHGCGRHRHRFEPHAGDKDGLN